MSETEKVPVVFRNYIQGMGIPISRKEFTVFVPTRPGPATSTSLGQKFEKYECMEEEVERGVSLCVARMDETSLDGIQIERPGGKSKEVLPDELPAGVCRAMLISRRRAYVRKHYLSLFGLQALLFFFLVSSISVALFAGIIGGGFLAAYGWRIAKVRVRHY